MNDTRFSDTDAARARLRATVAAIDQEIARLPRPVTTGGTQILTNGLAASWADLIEQLALGPEPDLRECPLCHHVGMRAATLCGHCWTKLPVLAGTG